MNNSKIFFLVIILLTIASFVFLLYPHKASAGWAGSCRSLNGVYEARNLRAAARIPSSSWEGNCLAKNIRNGKKKGDITIYMIRYTSRNFRRGYKVLCFGNVYEFNWKCEDISRF